MRILLFFFLICIYAGADSQLKQIPAESQVKSVTLFSSGARVERMASVILPAGRSEISFPGLSNQMDQQSIQLKADADITLLSVQASRDFLSARKIDQDEKQFIDQTQALKDKINLNNKMLEVYKNEEAMLIKNEAIGGQSGVKTTELKEALDLHRQRLTEVYQKQLEIEKDIASQQRESDRLNAQLGEISKKKDSINYIVTAVVDSKTARTVNFRLLYNVRDAGWYPAYDVRVSEVTSPLQLLMNANVFQRSGETWKNVSLLLSTGNPNDNATPSDLQPWKLGFYDPSVSFRGPLQAGTVSGRVTGENGEPVPGASVQVDGAGVGTVTDANGFFRLMNSAGSGTLTVNSVGFQPKEVSLKPGYFTITLKQATTQLDEVVTTGYLQGKVAGVAVNSKGLREEKRKSIQTVAVTTQYQPTTTVYKIQDKYTLETDGKTTTIGIKQFEVPALYEYITVPKIDPSAFLTARIINWEDYDLQPGEASLYYEGAYLGKTYMDLDNAGDTLSLSLGKDNGVRVTRKMIKEFSSKRFIGNNRTDTRQYEISIRNTKNAPVDITLQDQFPVSTTKDISVDDLKAPDGQLDEETGIVTWKFTVAPGQEKKVTLSYSVKYPKDKKVVLD